MHMIRRPPPGASLRTKVQPEVDPGALRAKVAQLVPDKVAQAELMDAILAQVREAVRAAVAEVQAATAIARAADQQTPEPVLGTEHSVRYEVDARGRLVSARIRKVAPDLSDTEVLVTLETDHRGNLASSRVLRVRAEPAEIIDATIYYPNTPMNP